ncbi:MAG: hypothetical protein K2J62_09350 [Bacteroidales bacterium]|nr:hypothetical protein [Bacteroidales bacterium]
MVQVEQHVFQSPSCRLETGHQFLHHPHHHTGAGRHRYLVAEDAPVKEVKGPESGRERRERLRGKEEKERGVIPPESGCRSLGC